MIETCNLVPMSFKEEGLWYRVDQGCMLDPNKIYRIPALVNTMHEVGRGSSCEKAHVGCVITDLSLKIQSVGYNRKPTALREMGCEELGCDPTKKCRLTIHAEMDAFSQLDIRTDQFGHVMFLPKSNCLDCLKHCVARNVMAVVFLTPYRLPEADRWAYERYAQHSGVKFYLLEGFHDVHV